MWTASPPAAVVRAQAPATSPQRQTAVRVRQVQPPGTSGADVVRWNVTKFPADPTEAVLRRDEPTVVPERIRT